MHNKHPRLCRLLVALVLSPALLCLSLPVTTAQQQGETRRLDLPNQPAQPLAPGRYHALVIGNNNYQFVRRLQTAEADAREVETLLRDSYGFQTKLLLNATRGQIIAALAAYRRELAPDANLLIYYAGHGYNDQDADKAYWLPVDASRDDPANWISADDITTTIRVIPARHVLIVSDSCYSGTLTREIGAAVPASAQRQLFLQKMLQGRSRTLMASGGNEPVADGGGSGHSVFAAALLRGLRQIDKPQFTAAELFRDYVEESVAGGAQQTPEYNPLRNSGHEAGDFVFVRVKVGDKTVEVTVKAPTSPVVPVTVDPAQQELAFWNSIQSSADAEDFKEYLARYPSGLYAGVARRRVAAFTRAPSAGNTARPAATPTSENTAANTPGATRPAGGRAQQMQSRAGIEFMWIPAGSFMMGASDSDVQRAIDDLRPHGVNLTRANFTDEQPQHQVTIREGFYMGRYEVTQAQWQAVMGTNPSYFKGDNLPVDSVSWNEAQDFINKLNEQNDGYRYRLPTEAEWEYACRAGTTEGYAGDLDEMAWYADNSVDHTHPVGQKQANAFGLFDMHGNVWEWCRDVYHSSYAGAPTDGSAWVSGGEVNKRALRGGLYNHNTLGVRSAKRAWGIPGNRYNDGGGLRVVAVARAS